MSRDENHDRSVFEQRALRIWPGLDRSRLRRTGGDPWRIARLVEGRTRLTLEDILVLLMGPELESHAGAGFRGARGRVHA